MEPQSPPKRMTRSRAAKVEANLKTTKIVTAATKARTARPAATSTTAATKRKARFDDAEDGDPEHDELDGPITETKPAKSRGRPRKTVEPEPEKEPEQAPVRTRGRPRKVVEEPPKKELTRATRATRARKAAAVLEDQESEEPEKKAARGRPAASSKQTTKATAKKTVTFEEPEKENMAPPASSGRGKAASAKGPDSASGLRAKPVRRPASSAGGRTTRGAASKPATDGAEKYEKPVPLSPKKVTQMALNNRAATESEDELAADEKQRPATSVRPRIRGPIKFPVRMAKPELPPPPSQSENGPAGDSTPGPVVILGSPCRRPPPSPWKDSLKSPAKRVDGIPSLSHSSSGPGTQPSGQSPMKASLLQSPAKRPKSPIRGLGMSTSELTLKDPFGSPFKGSLLSPAKRPFSPLKAFVSPKRQQDDGLERTPAPKPTLLATPPPAENNQSAQSDRVDETAGMLSGNPEDQAPRDQPSKLLFPGRLSAILPREADPAFVQEAQPPLEELQEMEEGQQPRTQVIHQDQECRKDATHGNAGDPMALDGTEGERGEQQQAERESTTPPASPPNRGNQMLFGLRERDTQPYVDESESEDELGYRSSRPNNVLAPAQALPSTPCPASSSRTPRTGFSQASTSSRLTNTAKRARIDAKFGFTPLAHKLDSWTAGPTPRRTTIPSHPADSPDVLTSTDGGMEQAQSRQESGGMADSPTPNLCFEEAMSSRDAAAHPDVEAATEADVEVGFAEVLEPEFDSIPVAREDMDLVQEAEEMARAEPNQLADGPDGHEDPDDTLSDASQEYGDENAVPIDPSLLPPPTSELQVPPVTPQRSMMRTFHTVSKVPLKPADDSTPRPQIRKRSHSISRLPVQRPTQGLSRSATVISYSPTKERHVFAEDNQAAADEVPQPETPGGASEAGWSTMGTPARTPRRDIDPALLRGAVVFVDVHTSEGADASGIFVELLTQMGARCVKSWPWNPTSPPGAEGAPASSKVGITHVVYKDGGKRTLEKVRESGGVVQCVGVSWVLDCERENQWLDEAPYYIDTSLVPRGGARRRKSMEPKALANRNGMLVSTPARNTSSLAPRDCRTAPAPAPPTTPINRRQSGLWVRTPEDELDGDDDRDLLQWDSAAPLTPLPKTPAPETIARYAAQTPSAFDDDEEGDTSFVAEREALVTRTCPPKRTSAFYELGAGVLSREKDQGVLMRLMAARRKSLQFAPKVASPLSQAWN